VTLLTPEARDDDMPSREAVAAWTPPALMLAAEGERGVGPPPRFASFLNGDEVPLNGSESGERHTQRDREVLGRRAWGLGRGTHGRLIVWRERERERVCVCVLGLDFGFWMVSSFGRELASVDVDRDLGILVCGSMEGSIDREKCREREREGEKKRERGTESEKERVSERESARLLMPSSDAKLMMCMMM